MITEDYVSFKVAKLLKEKGFNKDTYTMSMYDENGEAKDVLLLKVGEEPVLRPTLQMAMKWLREKHNLGVFPSWSQVFGLYGCRMYYLKKGSQEFYSVGVRYNTYEEACEAAIKYCLENLI